jgi:outer membrane protein TolC
MATKYLERIEKGFRTGNIREADYNQAKQRKLEAQLETADALRHAGEKAEGELALAEARGDQVKRAEARLSMATKYLERIEKGFRTGNIREADYNQAKRRKLEAELELQRARTGASP